jgi:hypothetical protein
MLALRLLKRSPIALDIYFWLTYRMFYLHRDTVIPWPLLQMQFGADYPQDALGLRHFKSKFLARLEPDQQREAWQKAADPQRVACRPVEGRPLEGLTKDKGIREDVVIALGLRFCGREYQDIMKVLTIRFGEDALVAAGLLKKSKTTPRLVPSFWHYFASKAGFLVIPYLLDGLPVYLKARPPVSKADAERLELVRFLNTAAVVPCLYNADALKGQPERVLICEGEADTWKALSNGFPAVGSPGSKTSGGSKTLLDGQVFIW